MNRCSQIVLVVVTTNMLTLFLFSSVYQYQEDGSSISTTEDKKWSVGFRQPKPLAVKFKQEPFIPKFMTNVIDVAAKRDKDFESMMNKRSRRLNYTCSEMRKHPTEPFPYYPMNLFVLPVQRIVWCPVFKAGSSNWLAMLLDLAAIPQQQKNVLRARYPNNYMQQGRAVAPQMSRQTWGRYEADKRRQNKTLHTFIVVRHPFERLVSAFRDKLERTHSKDPHNYATDYYYKTYGKKMVARFRKKAVQKFGDNFFSQKNNYGAPLTVSGGKRPSSDLPIFWEFVQYVISSRKASMDEHWRPTHNYCSLCMVDYKYVIKFENLHDELDAFLSHTGWDKSMPPNDKDLHINPNRPDDLSSADLTAKYFAQLSESDITRLYEVYANDFKMFGYNFTMGNIVIPPPTKLDATL